MPAADVSPPPGDAPVEVLVSGFEPFDGESLNPSRECVRALAGEALPGLCLSVLELPVSRAEAAPRLLDAIEQRSPGLLVMLGEAGGRERITPERVAINVDDFHIPDNRGLTTRDEPVVEGGPAAYFSTLPIKAMVRALEAAGIPAGVSNSAGTYLCNHVFYRVMHAIAITRRPLRAGFVHLPYLPEQASARGRQSPSLPLDTLVRGVEICIRTAVDDT